MRGARDIQSFHLNCKTINGHYKSMRYPMKRIEEDWCFLSLVERGRSYINST